MKEIKATACFVAQLIRFWTTGASVGITRPSVIERCTSDEAFPFLVSFPRTGSHWLRMTMELYFERPILPRAFFYPLRCDYVALHTHDMPEGSFVDVQRSNVIYLYRDPVDTVFSQLNYYGEDVSDSARVAYWSRLYGQHLRKWLVDDTFTVRKTVVCYDLMQNDPSGEFELICSHLGVPFERARLDAALRRLPKQETRKRTTHNRQVINLTSDYQQRRLGFRASSGSGVWREVLSGRDDLLAALRLRSPTLVPEDDSEAAI